MIMSQIPLKSKIVTFRWVKERELKNWRLILRDLRIEVVFVIFILSVAKGCEVIGRRNELWS